MAATLYRRLAEPTLITALADTPVVLIHGPRQCGKTTLALQVGKRRHYRYYNRESGDWLQQGLGTMPLEPRSTLVLAYQMGCGLEEIAAITSAPIATVKDRMLQAREGLRHFIPTPEIALSGLTDVD